MKLSKLTGILEDTRTNVPSERILVNNRLVGIEFEVENYRVSTEEEILYPLISCKEDGSLRNRGREIVTLPVKGKDIISAIDDVITLCSKSSSTVECTPRCGLHVHIDMRDCTTSQLNKVLALFCIMEGELFNYCGANRNTNPYCLPLNNHVMSSAFYKELFGAKEKEVSNALQHMTKYTSINLLPLFRYGTIEIRMHEGTLDKERIIEWVNMLLCLVDYGITFKGSCQNIVDSVCSSFKELVHNTFREIGIKSTDIRGQFLESAVEGARNFQQLLIFSDENINNVKVAPSRSLPEQREFFNTLFSPSTSPSTRRAERVRPFDITPVEEEEETEFFDDLEEPEEDNN